MRRKESASTSGGMMEELESMSLDMMMMGAEYSGTTRGDYTVPPSSMNASAPRSGTIKQVFANNRTESLRHLRRSSLASLYNSTATKVTFKGENDDQRSDSGRGRRMTLPAYPLYVTEVHFTFRREELSKDDVQSYWYSKQEIKQLAKRNKSLISSLLSHGSRNNAPRRHSFSTPDFPGSLNNNASLGRGMPQLTSLSLHGTRLKKDFKKRYQHTTTIVEKEQEDIAFSIYEDTCRGLESLINSHLRSFVREHKHSHRQIVLTEQNRQYETCEISPKMLAKCAQDSSESASVRAYIQGQQDAAELYDAMNMSSEVKAIVSSPVA